MRNLLLRTCGALAGAAARRSHVTLAPLGLDRDWADIDRLLAAEEWPFLRGDLEVSAAQPRATGLVARDGDRLAGFFTTHNFGDVGYLDMMIVAPGYRGRGVARPLYLGTVQALLAKGIRSLVVHTTNDSAPIIRFLGFTPGRTFTLLTREPGTLCGEPIAPRGGDVVELGPTDLAALIDLDAWAFGGERRDWIASLLREPATRWLGIRGGAGVLAASIAIRPRREDALAIDGVVARDPALIARLLAEVEMRHPGRRLECFAGDGSPLADVLRGRGYSMPEFFGRIGPLVEWRRGDTGGLGASPRVQCLGWF